MSRHRRTIDTAERQQLCDAGGKWVVICEDHGVILNVRTQAAARTSTTINFCDECREEAGIQ